MKLKRVTSLCLSWSFIIVAFSSIVLYVVPSGKIAHWTNWMFLGLGKEEWAALHTNNGYLFLLAGVLHIFFNFSHILNYLKNRQRQLTGLNLDSVVAFLLVVTIAGMTIFGLPPVSWIQDLNGTFKHKAELYYGSPPYGHAEQSTIEEFAFRTGQSVDDLLSKLKSAGYGNLSPDLRIEDLANANKISSQKLFQTLDGRTGRGFGRGASRGATDCLENENHSPEFGSEGSGSGNGYGRKTLEEVCQELRLNPDQVLANLRNAGYEAKLSDTIKTIAEKRGEHPAELIQKLKIM